MFITINRVSDIFYLFVYCLSCLNINRFFSLFFLHIITDFAVLVCLLLLIGLVIYFICLFTVYHV